MKMNLKELGTQAIESTSGTKKMRLSENASSMVFQLFTKNVYSNPIGTVVREITSNCFDSHIEAKVNAPVRIKKFKDPQTDTIYISFIDYGVGMSPDRVENIYGVYFESTKRIDNTQIGGFGIGGKTPLAYKRSTGMGEGEYDNSFYVITIFDKVKYYYCIFEGAESPEWNLLHSEPTTEGNGTEIRIPILEKDIEYFGKEMVRQLYYFENVIFEGFEDVYRYNDTLSNEYQIVRGKSFLYRGTEYSEYAHVCLGRVAYPIDFNVLGLPSSDYRLPIALRLEVGEIGVTVSRESLDYSENTIKILKKKLEVAKKEITDLLVKQYSNIVTLEEYFNVKNEFGRLYFSNGTSLYVGNLIKQSDVDFSNFRYSFTKMPNDKQLFKFFFNVSTYGKKPTRSRYSNNYEFEGGYGALKQNTNLLHIDGDFNRKIVKQSYLKDLHGMYHIISKGKIISRADIADLFNVHIDAITDDNGKPVAFVQSLYQMQEEYFAIIQQCTVNYDKLEIPEDYVLARKNRKVISEEMRKTTIPVKFTGSYGTDRISLANLFDYKCPIFYGTKEDEDKLRKAVSLFTTLFDNQTVISGYDDYEKQFKHSRNYHRDKNKKSSIMFIQLAQNNIKYMEFCKKAYHIDLFFVKMLYRKENVVREYFQTYKLIEKYDNLDNLYTDENFSILNDKWGAIITKINDYINTIPKEAKDSTIGSYESQLKVYFNLSDIKMTKEQTEIVAMIDDVKMFQGVNSETLNYIYYRNDLKDAPSELVNILKKVMAF